MDHARLLAELGAVAVGSGFLAFQTRRHKQEKEFLRAVRADLKLELEMTETKASSRGRALVNRDSKISELEDKAQADTEAASKAARAQQQIHVELQQQLKSTVSQHDSVLDRLIAKEKHTAQEFETVKAAAIQDRTDLMRQISALTQQHKTKLAKTEQDLQATIDAQARTIDSRKAALEAKKQKLAAKETELQDVKDQTARDFVDEVARLKAEHYTRVGTERDTYKLQMQDKQHHIGQLQQLLTAAETQSRDLKTANESASAAYEQQIRTLNQDVNKLEIKLALVEEQLHNSSTQALNEVHSLRTWVNGGEHSAQKLGQGLHTQMRHHELKVIQQEETICKLQRELDKQARQHAEEMAFHHKRFQKWLDDKHQQIQGILSELAAEKVKSSS